MRCSRTWIGALTALLLAVGAAEAQTKVAEVEVKGQLRRVAKSLILSTGGLKPGIELSQENVQEAIRALVGLNVFEDVTIWAEDVPGGVKVTYEVKELPGLEGIRFKGNKNLKERDMKEALGLVPGQVIALKDVARGRQKIVELYREKGYLRAEVEGQLFDAEEEGKVFLQYDIDEGQKVKIKKINILGTTAFDAGDVRKVMETKEKRWWRKGEFKGETFDLDKDKILAFYRSKGYQQASIVRDSVYYDETRKNLYIDVEIQEGQQYRLGQVSWDGNKLFNDEQLASKLELKPGDTYKYVGPELAYLAKSAYFEKGYLDTEVIPQETIHGDSINVHFQIYEGTPFKIRQIKITGNTKTREKVLRRELELRPGDVYRQSMVQESQRRLFMLNFFKDVQPDVRESRLEGERFVDLTFHVEEKPTGTASMGAGYSDRDKLVGTVGLQIPNLRGTGQNLDFNWEFGTRREQFLIGFTEPWLLDTPTSLSVRTYLLNQEYLNAFDRERKSVNVRVGRRLKRPAFSSVSFGYQLDSDRFKDFSEEYTEDEQNDPRFAPRTTSSFELVFRRDTRDLPQFPTRGTVFSYRPEVAATFVGSEVDFHSHEVIFNYYRPTWWKFVFSIESKIAMVDGFSKSDDRRISFFDRYSPGGVDWWDGQVRGYPDASLGPRTASGLNFGGRSMMVLNMEYRFPLVEQQVYGLLFADAGNAWEKVFDIAPNDLRRSAGFGFRVMTPMLGLIGFDFGYGFDRREVDGQRPGWNTHFQFGPRFF